jgi:hypothetical protein
MLGVHTSTDAFEVQSPYESKGLTKGRFWHVTDEVVTAYLTPKLDICQQLTKQDLNYVL